MKLILKATLAELKSSKFYDDLLTGCIACDLI